MNTTARQEQTDPDWQVRDQEARLLAELLRTSRVALLFGNAATPTDALLRQHLMPLLHRRASDQIESLATRESRVVVPLLDRRSRQSARAAKRRRELVIYFNEWRGSPLDALHACIHAAADLPLEPTDAPRAALAQALSQWSARLDARFIILLDGCEALLRGIPQAAGFEAFAVELADAINQPDLPANFLIALDEDARHRLAPLRNRVAGFDDFSLKLTRPATHTTAAPDVPVPLPVPATERALHSPENIPVLNEAVTQPLTRPAAASSAPPKAAGINPKLMRKATRTPPTPIAIQTEDVYALIESTLTHTDVDAAPEPFETPLGTERAVARRRADATRVAASGTTSTSATDATHATHATHATTAPAATDVSTATAKPSPATQPPLPMGSAPFDTAAEPPLPRTARAVRPAPVSALHAVIRWLQRLRGR